MREKKEFNAWKATPYMVVIPCMILYFAFFYFAAGRGFMYSLTDWNGISLEYSYIGLKNYMDAFRSKALWSTVRFTLIFAGTVIVCTNLLGILLAVLLDRNIKFRGFFRGLFFLPAVMSSLTIAYVFQQIDYRLITQIGSSIGNKTMANGLLANRATAPLYVSFIQVWLSTPITTVIYLAGLQSVPHEVIESSRIDGAGSWDVFLRVKLPLIIPSIMINLINTSKNAISSFDIIMGTTMGGPDNSTYSFAMYMYLMYSDLEMSYSCAIAMIMFVLFTLVALVQIISLRRREVEM